jgi:hypothetical protein
MKVVAIRCRKILSVCSEVVGDLWLIYIPEVVGSVILCLFYFRWKTWYFITSDVFRFLLATEQNVLNFMPLEAF